MKKIFYREQHVKTFQKFQKLSNVFKIILSTFEKLFNIIKKNQTTNDKLTRIFATKHFENFNAFDFFIFDNKHCVFRFVFAFIFFKKIYFEAIV